jgi:hypothetical protein
MVWRRRRKILILIESSAMNSRPFRFALALVLAATAAGCTILDRESYSIVIRKKAHQYDIPKLPPVLEPEEAAPSGLVKDSSDYDPRAYVRTDLDVLIDDVEPPLEPFRPFKYCHLHHSRHSVESVVAYVLAPVELPLGMATNLTYLTIDATIRFVMAPLEALFGTPEAPLKEEQRRKPK